MAAFGDRRLLARAGIALTLANLRFWPTVAPIVAVQLKRWEQHAQTIQDPALQALALQKLHEEHFNAQVAATLATLAPKPHRQATIEAIVAYEVIYDYLDGITEQPTIDPLTDGRDLYRAFTDAVSPASPRHRDYYASRPADDSGYLQQLVTVVQDALTTLPASKAIQARAEQAASRCAEAQLRAHAAPIYGTSQLEDWAACRARRVPLGWQEFLAGAASSVLAVHALIGAAATEHTTPEQAAQIDSAYLSICALSTLLDSLIDYDRDQQAGQRGYLDYYQSTDQLASGLAAAARRAIRLTRTLPNGGHHTMTLTGVAAYYLSAPTARSKLTRQATQQIRRELTPLITPTLIVMRVWRIAKRARINRHRCRRKRSPSGAVSSRQVRVACARSMGMSINQNFTIAVAGPVAEEIILAAGIGHADASWLLPDGTRTADPSIALATSLTVVAEKSRRGRIAEISAEMIDDVRIGLLAILAESSRPSEHHERAKALLDVVGAEAAAPPVAVELNLHEHRLTLLAALQVRTEMIEGKSDEDQMHIGDLWEVMKLADRRMVSEWTDGEGDW